MEKEYEIWVEEVKKFKKVIKELKLEIEKYNLLFEQLEKRPYER